MNYRTARMRVIGFLKRKKKERKVYLTDMGKLVAMGELTLRMAETGKTAREVMDDNEVEIQEHIAENKGVK